MWVGEGSDHADFSSKGKESKPNTRCTPSRREYTIAEVKLAREAACGLSRGRGIPPQGCSVDTGEDEAGSESASLLIENYLQIGSLLSGAPSELFI